MVQSSGPTWRMIFALTQIRSTTMINDNATSTPQMARIDPPRFTSGGIGRSAVAAMVEDIVMVYARVPLLLGGQQWFSSVLFAL